MSDPNPRKFTIRHAVPLPDPVRVARYRRVPELGPRMLFFTGGTAMRKISRALKAYTHNSIHLTTSFDSGGSSAEMRRAFDMLSVGDLRSRLMSLADETVRGNPEIYELFSHRLPDDTSADALEHAVQDLADGTHPLIAAVPEPLQHIIRNHVQSFLGQKPDDFELRGASIGNIVLVGGYLQTGRDIDAVIFMFSMLVKVLGVVRPITGANLHLAADLVDGTRILGQHLMTGKEVPPISSPIERLELIDSLENGARATLTISPNVKEYIEQAELICYPMGSFWTSLIATLLPQGVGREIARSTAPKVFIPNAGHDREMIGMKVHDCVRVLHETISRDAGRHLPITDVLDFVLVDTGANGGSGVDYDGRLDLAELESLGVQILDLPMANAKGWIGATAATEILLSMA